MHKFYLLITALVMSFTFVIAQPLVKVSGKVVDFDNNPLQQVTVAILGQQESTLTAQDGSYTIYSKKIDFTIKYNFLGYKPLLIKIQEKVAGRIVKTAKKDALS